MGYGCPAFTDMRRRGLRLASLRVEDAMAQDQKIAWRHDFEAAVSDAAAQGRHVLLDFSAAPM